MICSISTRNENRAYFCHPFKTAFLLYPVILGYVHLFFPCFIDYHSCQGRRCSGVRSLSCYDSRKISFLTTENLDGLLEGGNTVLAVWNKADCTKCATDFWDVRYLLYAFKDESDVLYWLVPQF